MKNASSYVKSLGFNLQKQGGKFLASRPLREESITEFKRSNNFYDIETFIKDGKVFICGGIDDVALVASELIDLETHDRKSIEKLISSCPYTLEEISNELLISKRSVNEETARLEKAGFVYRIKDLYFHEAFCTKDTAEKIPSVIIEKYKTNYESAKELQGTKIGMQLLDKAFFYKGLFLKSVFGGAENVHN